MTADERAPAKLNLTLHVTGRAGDGYHLLDSLVAFADLGERIGLTDGAGRLTVTGPMASGVPDGPENLALRAAGLAGGGLDVSLEKHLPAGAGLGGGSADAAAVLRAAAALGRPIPPSQSLMHLGADVPVCLRARPARMRGRGERLDDVPPLPPVYAALVWPAVPLSTGAVFAALGRAGGAPMPDPPLAWADAAEFAGWLRGCRNDLELPARTIEPAVGAALATVEATPGCLLARMTGSGSAVFGLYAARPEAEAAAAGIAARHPDWWVRATSLAPVS